MAFHKKCLFLQRHNYCKWFFCILIGIIGVLSSINEPYARGGVGTGLLFILFGILECLLVFFYVHMLHAFVIITEAAFIIVLEYQNDN